MLDVRKPLGLLFIILGAILFLYGWLISEPVVFHTPDAFFPLKLNMPVGAFMFAFGLVMWQLARYVELNTLDRELSAREMELKQASKKSRAANGEARGEPVLSEPAPEKSVAAQLPAITDNAETEMESPAAEEIKAESSEPEIVPAHELSAPAQDEVPEPEKKEAESQSSRKIAKTSQSKAKDDKGKSRGSGSKGSKGTDKTGGGKDKSGRGGKK